MLRDDELAILGESTDVAGMLAKDAILKYDEYEKQLLKEIGDQPLEVCNAQKSVDNNQELFEATNLNEAIEALFDFIDNEVEITSLSTKANLSAL